LRLWSVFGGRPIGASEQAQAVREIVASPDGSLVAVVVDGAVAVYAVPELSRIAELRLDGELVDIALSPGTLSCRVALDGAVKVVRHELLATTTVAQAERELPPVLVSGSSAAGRALGLLRVEC